MVITTLYDETDIQRFISYVTIFTTEGEMRGEIGDWIIEGINSELYPCKDNVFQQTYEEA